MGKKNYYFLLMFVMTNILAVTTSTVKAEAWDGTRKDIAVFTPDDQFTFEFTPTETKAYTFKCDTHNYAPKIKATWEGGKAMWSSELYPSEWVGAILTVDAVADRVITLTVSAPDEEEYPTVGFTFPLELETGGGGTGGEVVTGEPWDGSTMSITLQSKEDSKTFAYTATQNEMFYLFSKASAYDVKFTGGIVGTPDFILEWEPYDNMVGGYAAIKLMKDDVLNFTVTSTEFLDADNTSAKFPRNFSISSLVVPATGFSLPGATYENAVELLPDEEAIIPVNENSDKEQYPFFADYSEMSWLSFTMPKAGIANVDIEEYVLFVYETDENIGTIGYEPMRVIQDNEDNSHKFAVKANTTYYVVTTNNRPTKATLRFEEVEEGSDCVLPINITSTAASLSAKAGITWYNYTITKGQDSDFNLLELSSNNNWTGTISYYKGCWDVEPVINEVAAGAKSYFEMDMDMTNYLICVRSESAVDNAIKLVQRDPNPGEAKVNPLNARLGSNSYGGEKRNYWFKYVASKDCMLKITYPKDALKLITLGLGTTNVANPDETSCILRASRDEEYRLEFETLNANSAEFTISEEEIQLGDYCDYPRMFDLGDNIIMVNRDAMEEWYAFTALDDGTVEFEVEDPTWVASTWSCSIVKECGGVHDKLSYELSRGTLIYRYPVLKDHTYRFTVYQFYTGEDGHAQGDDIIIKTKFTSASEGESCDKAISVNCNEVVTCKDVKSDTWYNVVLPEDGIYYIVASLGQGASLGYKLGNCSVGEESANSVNYMYGRSYVELAETDDDENLIEMKKNQVVKIHAVIATDKKEKQNYDYSFIVRKKADGDDISTPFATNTGVFYKLGGGDVTTAATIDGCPYSMTTSADGKIEFTILTQEAFFEYSANFKLYSNLKSVGYTPTLKEKNDNGDDTYTYTYTLSGDNIESNKTYTVIMPFTVLGFNLGSSLITGIGLTNSSNDIIVYPNPTDGNFRVVLGELAAKGALIEVINMAGVPVYRESVTSAVVPVNLKGVASGVYFVRVYAGGKSAVAKLIVR